MQRRSCLEKSGRTWELREGVQESARIHDGVNGKKWIGTVDSRDCLFGWCPNDKFGRGMHLTRLPSSLVIQGRRLRVFGPLTRLG